MSADPSAANRSIQAEVSGACRWHGEPWLSNQVQNNQLLGRQLPLDHLQHYSVVTRSRISG